MGIVVEGRIGGGSITTSTTTGALRWRRAFSTTS
jgi:hypothetical protein